jgi:hypothetical protein
MQSPAFQDRNQSFGTGMNGFQGETPAPVGSPGLQHQQAQENAAGPARVKMSGSMNGMADSQYKATLGGMFGTQNGQADSTYETKKYFPGGM